MEARKIIQEKIQVRICQDESYKKEFVCTWEQLQNTRGLVPSDKVIGVGFFEHEKGPGFREQNPEEIVYTPVIMVIRPRPETDEEYFQRMREVKEYLIGVEEHERLEYLRLKAKFEGGKEAE